MKPANFDPEKFDPKNAFLSKPDRFKRFRLDEKPIPVSELDLDDDDELVVFEVGGTRRALLVAQMIYHHVAQGSIGDQPFLVTFCGVCNSGVGFSPVVDGKIHHFSAGGLYNGLVLLTDDETRTYWNHITGEALYGPLFGKQLAPFGVEMTTVKAEKARPAPASVYVSKLTLFQRLFTQWHGRRKIGQKGHLPPGFGHTMKNRDKRLPQLEQGLGVVINGKAKFYPTRALTAPVEDTFAGRKLTVRLGETDRVPFAVSDEGTRPFQLFTRWYGFSLTHRGCALYEAAAEESNQPLSR